MRNVTVIIYQNNGTTTPGNSTSISTRIVELADATQEVDGKSGLTKVAPGDIVVRCVDVEDALWAFLTTQLTLIPNTTLWAPSTVYNLDAVALVNGNAYVCTVAGTSADSGVGPSGTGTIIDGEVTWNYTQPSGMLPPWMEVYVAGTRVFLGMVDTSRVIRHQSADDNTIEIAAYNWSRGLSNTYLGSPTASPWVASAQYVAGQQCINGNSTYICTTSGISATTSGPSGFGQDIVDGTAHWCYVPPTWKRPIPATAVITEPGSGYANSVSTAYLKQGQYKSTIFATNPCTWAFEGALLTSWKPVFYYYLQSGVGLPAVPTKKTLPLPDPPPPDCCFPAGHKVTLANGRDINIEDLQVGMEIYAFDVEADEYGIGTVLEVLNPIREAIYHITLDDGTIISPTQDHPLMSTFGWVAIEPAHAYVPNCQPIGYGCPLVKINGAVSRVVSIKEELGPIQTYTISVTDKFRTFYCNDILAHNHSHI